MAAMLLLSLPLSRAPFCMPLGLSCFQVCLFPVVLGSISLSIFHDWLFMMAHFLFFSPWWLPAQLFTLGPGSSPLLKKPKPPLCLAGTIQLFPL